MMRGAELADSPIAVQGGRRDERMQHDPFQRTAAAQRNIDLSGSERSSGVHDDLVEGQSLAFVNRDGPGETKRELAEGAELLFDDLPRFFFQAVVDVFPFLAVQRVVLSAIVECDDDVFSVDVFHDGQFAVVISLLFGVVADKHDLRARFQAQDPVAGKCGFGKFALDLRLE